MSTRSEDYPLDVDVMTAGQLERRDRLTCTVIELLADTPPDHIQAKGVSERDLAPHMSSDQFAIRGTVKARQQMPAM